MQRHVVGIGVGLAIALGALAYASFRLTKGAPPAEVPAAVLSEPSELTRAGSDPRGRRSSRQAFAGSRRHATAESRESIEVLAERAAARYGISESLVAAVISVESEFNPRAVSHRGALGLMQLMPATAAVLGVRDAFDPRQNVDAGARHLRDLLNRFSDVTLALAAYNAGAQAVIKHGGVPPYPETRTFVARVLSRMHRRNAQPAAIVASATVAPRRLRVAARLTASGLRHEPDLVIVPAVAVATRDDEPRVERARSEPVGVASPREPQTAPETPPISFGAHSRVESP